MASSWYGETSVWRLAGSLHVFQRLIIDLVGRRTWQLVKHGKNVGNHVRRQSSSGMRLKCDPCYRSPAFAGHKSTDTNARLGIRKRDRSGLTNVGMTH